MGGHVRLLSLEVRDFRGVDQLDLSFGQDEAGRVAVLAGDNGSGKTSVLDAIAIALGQLDVLPPDRPAWTEQVRWGAKKFELRAKVRLRDGAIADSIAEPIGIAQLEAETRLGALAPGIPSRLDPSPTRPARYFPGTVRLIDAEVAYHTSRRPRRTTTSQVPPEMLAEDERRLFELKRPIISAYYRALRDGRTLARTAEGGPHGSSIPADSPFGRLQGWVSRFLGPDLVLDVVPPANNSGLDDEVVIRWGSLPTDFTSLAQARIQAAAGGPVPKTLPIDRLSSGQLGIIALAGPLIFRDRSPDIVLIDEPEQHLHPRWQRVIVPALRELLPDSQIIAATQSAIVLSSVLPSERRVLPRPEDPQVDWADATAVP